MKNLLLTLPLFFLFSCGESELSQNKLSLGDLSISSQSNFLEETNQIWDGMRLSHFNELQPGCEPIKLESNKNVSQKGLVILLHGFSACPQQYDELAPRLAKAGYDVLVPLFPGHGVVPDSMSPRRDNTDYVPKTATTWKSFRNDVNKLAESYDGKRSLTGLSMGTNLALSAYIKRPDLYENVVGVSPKLRNETSFFHGLLSNDIHILNVDEWILGQRSGWDSCITDSGLDVMPRNGFCNFENRNAVAMLQFGNETIKDSAKFQNTTNTKVQIILSHNDDGVANNGATELAGNLTDKGVDLSLCKMPSPVPHSMFSPYDQPRQKPWLEFLFSNIEKSLTTSADFPTLKDSPEVCGWVAIN